MMGLSLLVPLIASACHAADFFIPAAPVLAPLLILAVMAWPPATTPSARTSTENI